MTARGADLPEAAPPAQSPLSLPSTTRFMPPPCPSPLSQPPFQQLSSLCPRGFPCTLIPSPGPAPGAPHPRPCTRCSPSPAPAPDASHPRPRVRTPLSQTWLPLGRVPGGAGVVGALAWPSLRGPQPTCLTPPLVSEPYFNCWSRTSWCSPRCPFLSSQQKPVLLPLGLSSFKTDGCTFSQTPSTSCRSENLLGTPLSAGASPEPCHILP